MEKPHYHKLSARRHQTDQQQHQQQNTDIRDRRITLKETVPGIWGKLLWETFPVYLPLPTLYAKHHESLCI